MKERHDYEGGEIKLGEHGSLKPDLKKSGVDNLEEANAIAKTNRILKNIPGENHKRKTHRGETFMTIGPTSVDPIPNDNLPKQDQTKL